jgi:biotin carboxyl carrier protein
MTAPEVRVDGAPTPIPDGGDVRWLDAAAGVARVTLGERSVEVLVEGSGPAWTVTLAGRRIAVAVVSHRERLLAEAERGTGRVHHAAEVHSTLPGLVVTVAVAVGDPVATGDRLVVIEAMKMQNEIRSPRNGVVAAVLVEAGVAVTAGALLVRIDDAAAVQSPPDERPDPP